MWNVKEGEKKSFFLSCKLTDIYIQQEEKKAFLLHSMEIDIDSGDREKRDDDKESMCM